MKRSQKIFFQICLLLSVVTMVAGHLLIINSGAWFIRYTEKYNIFTRWVSDFAAKWPEGLWIKGSIFLFIVALFIFKRARLRTCTNGLRGHASWGWNMLLACGLIFGLSLVALYDMSPPQFTTKEPSWFGKLLGEKPVVVVKSGSEKEFIKQWHHKLGFQMFIFSFAAMLITAVVEKWRIKDSFGVRRDVFFLILTGLFMFWLLAFHNTLAGIPQRALLILIFCWVWSEGARFARIETPPAPDKA